MTIENGGMSRFGIKNSILAASLANNAALSNLANKSAANKSTYREVKIGKTLYCVTSVFTGEKELGSTLEKLAAQSVLDEIDGRAKAVLRA